MSGGNGSLPAWARGWAERLERRGRSPAFRRWALAASFGVLALGAALAIRSHPQVFDDLRGWPLLGAVALVPVVVLLNSMSFALSARLAGCRFRIPAAAEVSIVSTAANLLPLPGGPVTRVAALCARGVSKRQAVWATVLAALVWASVACSYAGAWIVAKGIWWVGLAFVVPGLALGGVALTWATRLAGGRVAALLAFVHIAQVLVETGEIWFCLRALGSDAGPGQAGALVVAGVAGSIVGIAPAGLGVREAVSAALAGLVQVPAALGFLSAALKRIVDLGCIAPVALLMAARRGKMGPGGGS